jgi:phosphate transport system substrate-binding protein
LSFAGRAAFTHSLPVFHYKRGNIMINRTSIIMGGMAAAIALTAASGASAAATTPVYAGGSTLVEKVYRDLFNTYGNSSAGDLCRAAPAVCPTKAEEYNSGVELLYVGVGSGNGLTALETHTSSNFVAGGKTPDAVPTPSGHDFGAFYGTGLGAAWVPGTGVGPNFPTVTFADSDSNLAASDVAAVAKLGFGPVIQIPGLVAAIAVPFNPSAGWNPKGVKPTGGSSNVQLSTSTLCGIFTGQITKWSDASIKADNKGTQLGTGTITVVYRNDSSGTTFLFTNALLNQCGTAAHPTNSKYKVPAKWVTDAGVTVNAKAPFYTSNTKFYITLFGKKDLPANFLNNETLTGVTGGANGGGGVKKAILATTGSIGYVSPDNVQPAASTGPQAANIQSYFSFVNKKTPVYIAPTPATATYAMLSQVPPAFNGSASNPLNWGATEPVPANAAAYPIAGFSFIDLYTCYKSAATVAALAGTTGKVGYLDWYYGTSTVNKGSPAAILKEDGFAPVPTKWSTAINTLLRSPYLGINVPGTKACAKITKGA